MPTRRTERELWESGHAVVAGIDEVGRGAMAGPVTAAAVVLPDRCRLRGVRDSKLMTSGQRERMAAEIKCQALAVGIGWASSQDIDQNGLTIAIRRAAERALTQLALPVDIIILDGLHNYLGATRQVKTLVKADQSCLAVAAASVIAKVARDRYMQLLSKTQPQYGWESNKGYRSRDHFKALDEHGLSPDHRRRWRSIQNLPLQLEYATTD